MASNWCVENVSCAILKALTTSTPKRRPREDPVPSIPAGVHDDIRLRNQLRRRWQITREPVLRAEVNRLPRLMTHRLKEWGNDQWSATF